MYINNIYIYIYIYIYKLGAIDSVMPGNLYNLLG